jgi:hypothetical protein
MCLPQKVHDPSCVLAEGTHLGHEWVVVKNEDTGFRCGYVKVESRHPWHGKGYDQIDAHAHGGLTFAHEDVPCGGDDTGYWIGFDAGHFRDARDMSIMNDKMRALYEKLNAEHECFRPLPGETIKDTPYMIEECKRLCEQAAAAAQ